MIFLLVIIIVSILYCFANIRFKKTTYHTVTHNSFLSTKFNLGRNGEYLIYDNLKGHESKGGKFLFNCYLPKGNGETSEIDVLLICESGIFVFESKNYSGWIFGDEKAKKWTQTLPQGRGHSNKEHFLNPIIQNKSHIKWLKRIIGEDIPVYSLIVFSDRCTLKKVSVESPDIYVIKRNRVYSLIPEICKMQMVKISPEKIAYTYEILYPYTQITDEVKRQHIKDIQSHHDETKNNLSMSCPRCGAKLVVRTAKRGANAGKQFMGCSDFPKCRYMRNI